MVENDLEGVKAEARSLKQPSRTAVHEFGAVLPRLATMVTDRFAVESRIFPEGPSLPPEPIETAQKTFGRTLHAIYEFGLLETLVDEFAWQVSMLTGHGLERDHFKRMIDGWIMAIYATIKPPEAEELVRPLKWLGSKLPVLSKPASGAGPKSPELERFLDLLLSKKRDEAADYLISLLGVDYGLEEVFEGVMARAMSEIGLLWQLGKISVSDEHAATEIARYVVFRVADSLGEAEPLSYKALVSCGPGEDHQLGAAIVAGYLGAKGWAVRFLGRGSPEGAVIDAQTAYRADVILLSVTLIMNLPPVKSVLEHLRQLCPSPKLVLGGRAALAARSVMGPYCDSIVGRLGRAHEEALRLVTADA
jgi:methanogenic corrinoid protein MtbC1